MHYPTSCSPGFHVVLGTPCLGTGVLHTIYPHELLLGKLLWGKWFSVLGASHSRAFPYAIPLLPLPKLTNLERTSPGEAVQTLFSFGLTLTPPAQLWMENKEVIDVLHVSLLLILLCKPPDTHLYLLGLPALLLRCTTVFFFFHSWLLWIICFELSFWFLFPSFFVSTPFPFLYLTLFLVLWGMVFIF